MESGGGIRKNPTLICAPIMADSVDKMLILMAKANASTADLVEIRLDSLKTLNPSQDLKVLIKECPLPTLFTYRFQVSIFLFIFYKINGGFFFFGGISSVPILGSFINCNI